VKAWDIAGPGERADAVVGIVLDVSEGVWDVVACEYHKREDYPITAWRAAQLHERYPGPTVIESNEAGKAVISFILRDGTIPEHELHGHSTNRQSKPEALGETRAALESMTLKWKREEVPELDAEMRLYKLDDKALKQDTVMALSIAVHWGSVAAAERSSEGRILGVYNI
jgi:hypothetical protein